MTTAFEGAELAEARHRAYALFGQAFVQGLAGEVGERLASLPALADVLPTGDPDEAAAEHHQALSLEVFPFESVFLDPEGLLEGPSAAEVLQAYRAAGFQPDTRSLAADHVGLELAFLAHLSAAESDALRDDADPQVQVVRAHTTAFLDAHLLRWLPALVVALEQQASSPWLTRLAHLALELVVSHRTALGSWGELMPLPPAELDLDDAETRLRDIVRHLVHPAQAGLFLSRAGIGRIAQSLSLPGGFGPRERMLEQVVFTAVDHQATERLFAAIDEAAGAFDAGLRELETVGADVSPWRTQLAGTRRILAKITEKLSEGA